MCKILEIAHREADEAYRKQPTPESASQAFQTISQVTWQRGMKAEQLLASGAVKHEYRDCYTVRSQSGNGVYTVYLNARTRTCTCPDFTARGLYCKHLQAAEIYAYSQESPTLPPEIAIETTGFANGRKIHDQKVKRVRTNGKYRAAKSDDFHAAVNWLQEHGYDLVQTAQPRQKVGTVTVRYIYRRGA